jgi:hypothetical protein
MFRRLSCSFCGRRAADVAKLVAGPPKLAVGPRAYICDRCIAAATEIIRQTGGDDSPPVGFWRRLAARLARVRALGRGRLLMNTRNAQELEEAQSR